MTPSKKLLQQALAAITQRLSKTAKEELSVSIQLLTEYLAKPRPGEFWQDPEKRKATQAKMRETKSVRLRLTWRSAGKAIVVKSYAEAGQYVKQTGKQVALKLSRKDGVWSYKAADGDVITIVRLENSDG